MTDDGRAAERINDGQLQSLLEWAKGPGMWEVVRAAITELQERRAAERKAQPPEARGATGDGEAAWSQFQAERSQWREEYGLPTDEPDWVIESNQELFLAGFEAGAAWERGRAERERENVPYEDQEVAVVLERGVWDWVDALISESAVEEDGDLLEYVHEHIVAALAQEDDHE